MKKLILLIIAFSLNFSFIAQALSPQEEMIKLATQQMKKIIELMDESGDSSVSLAEYSAYHNQQAAIYDTDINQLLSLDEYKQWVYSTLIESASQNPQIKQQLENEKFEIDASIETSFKKFDMNNDNAINKEELAAVHLHNMNNADLNKDQLLNMKDVERLKELIRS